MKLTLRKTIVCLMLCAVMLFAAACQNADVNKDQSAGDAVSSDNNNYVIRIACNKEKYRFEAVEKAAEKLNEQLKAEGSADTVTVEYVQMDDYGNSMTLWMKENTLPEIVVNSVNSIEKYYDVGAFVDVSYIVNDEVFTEKVPQNVRDMALKNGAYYAVMQDLDARFVIVYKPALVQLGWSEEQIEQWKNDARAGKITTKDLQDVAKQVVDAGICEYGITHRPNKGADWRFTFITWNHGEIPINEQGQIVISRQNIIEYLTYWRENVQMGLAPYNHLTDYNWDMLEGDMWPNGKSFCWYGHVDAKASMMEQTNLTSEEADANYFSIPNPVTREGDTPVSGVNPQSYGLTTSSQVNEKMSEYCRRLMDLVLDLDIQLQVSLNTTHIAVTTECSESEEYLADGWMSDLTYLTEYMFALPRSEYLSMYGNSQEMYDAIQQAEMEATKEGGASIEEITDSLIAKMTFNMGEGNYVLVD